MQCSYNHAEHEQMKQRASKAERQAAEMERSHQGDLYISTIHVPLHAMHISITYIHICIYRSKGSNEFQTEGIAAR